MSHQHEAVFRRRRDERRPGGVGGSRVPEQRRVGASVFLASENIIIF